MSGGHDGIRVDREVVVQITDRTGLAKVFNSQGDDPVPAHGPKPRQGQGMAVHHGDDRAMGRQVLHHPFNGAGGALMAALARAHGGGPALVFRSG